MFTGDGDAVDVESFSALQRAENSSIQRRAGRLATDRGFQCSSASRKFLNWADRRLWFVQARRFQCSSASRKFLNLTAFDYLWNAVLFQCSSASRKFLNTALMQARTLLAAEVSVLFSEPKIPQFGYSRRRRSNTRVSVLFSEPKIPQSDERHNKICVAFRFSALQRAENSSITSPRCPNVCAVSVSVLFSEPKIPQCRDVIDKHTHQEVSVLFSEPKIPQLKRSRRR